MVTKKKKQEAIDVEPVERSNVVYDRTGWSFFVNDERVTEEQYIAVMEEHMRWVEEQKVIAAVEAEPDIKRQSKKKR